MRPSTGSSRTPTLPPSGTAPASGCSSAHIRCSCASGWAPICTTTHTRAGRRNDRLPSAMTRNDLLGEIAGDAGLERTDFLASAAAQLRGFLEANEERLRQLGGLVLIDEEPDYLSVAPDGTFRSRTRYQDADGKWHSETEVVESAADLIELYNPADIYAAFIEAAKEAAGMEAEPTGAEDLPRAAGVSAADTIVLDEGRAYAEAADRWAEGRDEEPRDAEDAAHRLYDLALEF